MKVVVMGSASHLARALLPNLVSDARIDSVVGVDIKPSLFTHAKFTEQRLDMCLPELRDCLTGADALVHLAFVVFTGHLGAKRFDRDFIQRVNREGSANVFSLAAQQGVTTLIYLSSAVVYGAFSDNPYFMRETQALRPMPGFGYSEDKVAVEKWLDEFERDTPQTRIVRLRPHVIIGEHAQPLLIKLLKQPGYFRLDDPQPLTQLVWEEDVASAIVKSLFSNARGSFNLASNEVISFYDIQHYLHCMLFLIPYHIA